MRVAGALHRKRALEWRAPAVVKSAALFPVFRLHLVKFARQLPLHRLTWDGTSTGVLGF